MKGSNHVIEREKFDVNGQRKECHHLEGQNFLPIVFSGKNWVTSIFPDFILRNTKYMRYFSLLCKFSRPYPRRQNAPFKAFLKISSAEYVLKRKETFQTFVTSWYCNAIFRYSTSCAMMRPDNLLTVNCVYLGRILFLWHKRTWRCKMMFRYIVHNHFD